MADGSSLRFPAMGCGAMSQISIFHDVKSASFLGGSMGLLGAVTVPVLLPSIFELAPPEHRGLPLPLPVFCIILAIQLTVVYGLIALGGMRLARSRNREPAPVLTAIWTKDRPIKLGTPAVLAFVTGLLCGLTLVGTIGLIKRFLPETLPETMHPSSFWGTLLASATASVGEEILCRLFLLSALLRILPVSNTSTAMAVVVSSLVFGALHAPAAIFLFGGFHNVPPLAWLWMMSLNAFVGIACAHWFLRTGIGGAILTHFGTDLVWHVFTQLS